MKSAAKKKVEFAEETGTATIVRADIRKAAQLMSAEEARYMVDLYYQIQEFRKASGNQIGALKRADQPPALILDWVFGNMEGIENTIKKALDDYTSSNALGQWVKGIVGIGPVIAAGLLAHIDFNPWHCKQPDDKCTEKEPHPDCGRRNLPTVGAIWRFAGLDPTSKWDKGQKRPWNAALKRLCWLAGESFVKVSNNPKSLYGKLYSERKAMEQAKNERGDYAEQATAVLATRNIGKATDAWKWYSGQWALQTDEAKAKIEAGEEVLPRPMLPPAHIHARAKRWAVKLFLSHYFEEGCRKVLNKEPPVIYSIAMLGHIHKIEAEKS